MDSQLFYELSQNQLKTFVFFVVKVVKCTYLHGFQLISENSSKKMTVVGQLSDKFTSLQVYRNLAADSCLTVSDY